MEDARLRLRQLGELKAGTETRMPRTLTPKNVVHIWMYSDAEGLNGPDFLGGLSGGQGSVE